MSLSSLLEMDKTLHSLVATEFLKLRRSKVTWVTFFVYTLMVCMVGFFMWMMMHPGMAERLGLLGQKANLTVGGQPMDWPTFLGLLLEIVGAGGLMFLAFILTYVFGREYVEGTAKNMLTLPVPRQLFVIAKLVVAAVWFALLTLWLLPLGFVVGTLVGLPGFDPALFWRIGGKMLVASLLVFCSGPLVAWVAVATRGYFAPLGYAMFTLVLASVFGHTGWGPWVPWTIVGIYSGASGVGSQLAWGSYVVLGATFALGLGLAMRHEASADNVQ